MSEELVYIVDDNSDMADVTEMMFMSFGFKTKVQYKSSQAFDEIKKLKPYLVILDKMMPELDGIELCKIIRKDESLKGTHIVMLSSKSFAYDKKQAFEAGVDEYMHKPITGEKIKVLLDQISTVEMKFWGVRGTLPVPGPHSLKYGGNTNCVTLEFPGNRLFILDAGSGVKNLANELMRKGKPVKANMLISHHHWDHINAFPFFTPLYIPGNDIGVWGPHQGEYSMKRILSDQMDGVYFPVTISEFAAHVHYHNLDAGQFEINQIQIESMFLNHPGVALAYKFHFAGKSIVYMTDNEIFPEASEFYVKEMREEMVDFCKGAEVLCHDTTYLDSEYPSKVQWGHSAVSEVVDLAHDANVKQLSLIHHDPDQKDENIDQKLEDANSRLKEKGSRVECICPREGDSLKL